MTFLCFIIALDKVKNTLLPRLHHAHSCDFQTHDDYTEEGNPLRQYI